MGTLSLAPIKSKLENVSQCLLKNVRFTQRLTLLILIGQQRRAVHRPFDADGRIVPGNATFALRGVEVSRFVQELGRIAQGDEAMSETCRDPELVTVFR